MSAQHMTATQASDITQLLHISDTISHEIITILPSSISNVSNYPLASLPTPQQQYTIHNTHFPHFSLTDHSHTYPLTRSRSPTASAASVTVGVGPCRLPPTPPTWRLLAALPCRTASIIHRRRPPLHVCTAHDSNTSIRYYSTITHIRHNFT